MSSDKNQRILVIDDNRAIHDDFRKILSAGDGGGLDDIEDELFGPPSRRVQMRYEIDSAFQGQDGFAKVRASREAGEPYALAFVDMRMPPGWDGVETIARIWEVDPEIQIVICSAYSDYSWDDLLQRFGVADRLLILKKPFDTAEVSQLTCALTEKWSLARHASLKLSQLRAMVEEQTRELTDANRRLEQEIAERQRSEEALRVSESRYALALAGANDGLWDWDRLEGKVFYSARWRSMLGLADRAVSGSADEWFGRVQPDDLPHLEASLAEHLDGRAAQFCAEYRMRHEDGAYRWMLCRGVAVRDPSGKVLRLAGSQTDITDRRTAEEQLRFDAFHDALTGLANRALLMERLERCLCRARRHADEQFAVLYLDLDRFKIINDSLGHMVGDQLLIALARRLTARVRQMDTVALLHDTSHLVRLGGDEFVILLERLGKAADAVHVAERVQQAIAEPFRLDEQDIFTSASIGIALSRPGYERPEEILRDADTALYRAKAAGRGGFLVFDPEMHASAMARWRTENELRRAIERDELEVHYQPIVSLETGEVVELEALVRWRHPERGMVPPGEFIPLAEETGLIVPLGLRVLRAVCERLARFRAELPDLQLSVAVNVSAKQLAQPGFVEETARLLEETGVEPARLVVEITESVFLDGASSTMERLAALRRLGVRLHLDDFGTGYSSLSYLHRMPIDGLKIDRSFVQAMGDDRMSASIVQAIVALAHTLGTYVIGEGVETAAQMEQLRSIRCDAAQGYHLHRPLDAAQTAALLSTMRRSAARAA